MANESTTPEASGANLYTTTKRREWLGWTGIMFWLYSMINGYQYLPNSYEKAIRQKLNLMNNPDPVISAIVAEYKLTKRETDMIKYLRDGFSIEQIAAESFITEDTVRYHIRNLLKKLDVDKRQEIAIWLGKRV